MTRNPSQERTPTMRKRAAERTGTYCLVRTGTGAVIVNDLRSGAVTHIGISLTFGLIVLALVDAIGDISGCHINPAVTIGLAVDRRSAWSRTLPYLACQCIGAILASGSLRLMFPNHARLGATLPAGSWQQSFMLEVFLTFLLMFVVLCVATGAKERGIMAGTAIGSIIALEALFGGPLSRASMNPARSLGPALVSGNCDHLWVYFMAPLAGAVFGVIGYRIVKPADGADELS